MVARKRLVGDDLALVAANFKTSWPRESRGMDGSARDATRCYMYAMLLAHPDVVV